MASSKRRLMNLLSAPSKVASALDWRKLGGSVMTLAVHGDRIEVIASHHPSDEQKSGVVVESLPLEKKGRMIPEFTKQRLMKILKDEDVCGIVVSCPVQNDTGKLGYAAGRTLWLIEQLLGVVNGSSVLPQHRPICLWDGVHTEQPPVDEWGRSAVYANTSSKPCHLASQEQYHQDEGILAARVWEDFVKNNWPDLYRFHPSPLGDNSSQKEFSSKTGNETEFPYWDSLYENDDSALAGISA
ncbi:hypothetical protein IV203_010778 [Nitzschia inconspicua]|uniref:Uncharacterized protein n=1 Tax=Nitzschia inconspicua TaxID=303405 RepID=A0A9K3PL83_9STRA|nr:hypothetical protein IV203_010778 [Nitzschia inconspicua]